MRCVFLPLFLVLVPAAPAAAQDADATVRAVVESLFDGMRTGDSTAVRSVFHPEARLQTAHVRDDRPVLQTGSVDRFVEAVGTPHDDVWDERIANLEIRVDGRLAQVWMDYAFYLGDAFSHCGVNAMQLFDDGDSWTIIQITDTRRKEDCRADEN